MPRETVKTDRVPARRKVRFVRRWRRRGWMRCEERRVGAAQGLEVLKKRDGTLARGLGAV
jgi:hypothetical protein